MQNNKKIFDVNQAAYVFSSSIFFKIWQKYCRIKYKINKSKKNALFIHSNSSFLSIDWIKHVIVPSTAFKLWNWFYQRLLKQYRLFVAIINDTKNIIKRFLPPKIKRLIRRNFPYLLFDYKPHLSPKILHEWKKWYERRSNNSMDVINFGVIAYDYRHQRPQHLAEGLGHLGNRVFYIENEFIYAPNPQNARYEVVKKTENVYAITLSSAKNYFIYSDKPSDSDIEIIFASLKKLLRDVRGLNLVAKIDHPFWASLSNKIGMPLVYDVMDLHSGFTENSPSVLNYDSLLSNTSNLVITSSAYLSKKYSEVKTKSLLLKNAGDYNLFQKAHSTRDIIKPSELKNLPGAIIGYYGAIADWLDLNLIEKVAITYPHDSIVLIGRNQNSELESLVNQHPNIHLIDEVPYHQLPSYLAYFDVCLIPFKLTELIKATNPVKIYEYFAAGKPVVSTNIPELKEYKELLYSASTPTSFSAAVGHALRENSETLPKLRQEISKSNTWKLRVSILQKQLLTLVFPRVSVIILTYNNVRLSQISIDSVLNRSKYANLEIVIVDNNSEQKTVKMLQKYKDIKNIKIIFNKDNYGFAKGNNIGMRVASGEFLVLLNNDVRVTPGWISRLVYYGQKKNVGLVGPVTNSIGNEAKIPIFYDPEDIDDMESIVSQYTYEHWNSALSLNDIAAFAWLEPRKVYEKIGDLDERYGRGLFEDDDYCVRVKKAGYDILCAEDAFVHHYGGASTNWGSPEYHKLFNENKEKFEQKWRMKWAPHHYRKY